MKISSWCGRNRHPGGGAASVARDRHVGAEGGAVEAGDTLGRSGGDRELHVRHTERHVAERGAGRVAPEHVAPGRHHSDVLVLDGIVEQRPGQPRLDVGEPPRQLVEVRDDEADVAAQDLGVAGGQVELLLPMLIHMFSRPVMR